MEGGAWLARMRWRRRGAWLWPAFVIATVADAVIGHALPPSGETQTVLAAALAGWFLNLFAVLLSGLAARRDIAPRTTGHAEGRRTRLCGRGRSSYSLPARCSSSGIVHRPSVLAHRRAMEDAIVRAQAFIGARAPAEFRRNIEHVEHVRDRAGQHLPDVRAEAIRTRGRTAWS